jgi:catechol 2,3-dioxygenase-like lactoylglutathione lyase family enzyme
MIETIEKMVSDFENGKVNRRQFAASLVALATATRAMYAATASSGPTSFQAISINHVTVRVPDLHRTSRFYQEFFGLPLKQQSATVHILGVGGSSFFGIEQGADTVAKVDHYDFGISHFNADEIRAKLRERGLKFSDAKSQESFKFFDLDGFQVQVNAPDYVGHVS